MLKNNMKKIIITLISVFLLVSIACTTYATEGNRTILDEVNEMLQEENKNINLGSEGFEEIQEGTKNNTNTNTNDNENKPATTPHAGLEDYSGIVFVLVFGISAIYAYKKVKEYNV